MSRGQNTYVVGGGACTSIGTTLSASAAAVRAGVATFGDHPFMMDSAGQPMVVSRASYLPDDVSGVTRLLDLAVPAMFEALANMQDFRSEMPPLPVILGLPPRRPGLPESVQHEFSTRFRRRIGTALPIGAIEVIAHGHSSGLMALEAGMDQITSGAAQLCLIGGVDSYIHPETLEWLEESEQLHSAGVENNAWGFIPGEGAGFCLLASTEAARRWRLDRIARIAAVAVTREQNLIKTDSVCLGHGLTAAFENVFQTLPDPGDRVDEIICDMNGEPYRAEEFGFATIRTNDCFVDAADFQAPADCWGDVGAASGPLFLNLSVEGHRKGYSRSLRTLVWTSSEGGERAAAILDFTGALLRSN